MRKRKRASVAVLIAVRRATTTTGSCATAYKAAATRVRGALTTSQRTTPVGVTLLRNTVRQDTILTIFCAAVCSITTRAARGIIAGIPSITSVSRSLIGVRWVSTITGGGVSVCSPIVAVIVAGTTITESIVACATNVPARPAMFGIAAHNLVCATAATAGQTITGRHA